MNAARMILFRFVLLCFTVLFYDAAIAQRPTTEKDTKRAERAAKRAERLEKLDELITTEEQGTIVYNKQNIFGIKLNNDGYGAYYERGRQKTVEKASWWSIELGERMDPKQEKLSRLTQSGLMLISTPLIFGKENNFYFAKLGFGQSRLIGGKGIRNGVAVSALYGGGLSLGLLKPYVVQVIDPVTNQSIDTWWKGDKSRTDTLILDKDALYGSAGMGKGWNEVKIVPGAFAKAALRFDYGRYNEMISAIQCGVNAEFYTSKMPVMINNEGKNFFVNVFVALEFGRRK